MDKDETLPITENEVIKAIKRMKNGKAFVHDSITAEHMKYGGASVSKYLCRIYNSIVQLEEYPHAFKRLTVVPLFKGGKRDKMDKNNYRDISISSQLQKVFEKILFDRLYPIFKQNKFPHELQQGFRPKCSSLTAAFTMKETISYYIENNSCIYAAYLDNEKAFNGVWITGLLYKLFNIGVRGRYWRIIKSSCQDIVSSVFFNGVYSESYQIKQGVGQGRTLSSWMFLAMINDLIPELISLGKGAVVNDSHIPCILIADDTSWISPTLNGLRAMLDTVGEYASKWRLKYNASKGCFMIFGGKKHQYGNKSFNISLNGTALERVSNVKYAGIDIDCNLRIRNAVTSRCKRV
ncbi:hypothetical protein SNE40_003902 [Patella caerulea]|uniref:Reverse transcriptase domain-containing protein n=1 Tax=Patella caerulea TaxID=87958 RepID=A0AAN8KCG0_PATCE